MPVHQYEVELTDGRRYDVNTQHHHDDHDPKAFQDHLLDILKSTVSGLISGLLVRRVTYRGRK